MGNEQQQFCTVALAQQEKLARVAETSAIYTGRNARSETLQLLISQHVHILLRLGAGSPWPPSTDPGSGAVRRPGAAARESDNGRRQVTFRKWGAALELLIRAGFHSGAALGHDRGGDRAVLGHYHLHIGLSTTNLHSLRSKTSTNWNFATFRHDRCPYGNIPQLFFFS